MIKDRIMKPILSGSRDEILECMPRTGNRHNTEERRGPEMLRFLAGLLDRCGFDCETMMIRDRKTGKRYRRKENE